VTLAPAQQPRFARLAAFPRPRRSGTQAWLVILPGLVLVGLFSVYPLVYALYISMHRLLLTRPDQTPFIGLRNFVDVLAASEIRIAALRTGQFALLTVPAVMLLGLGVALLLNQRLRGMWLLRWIILLPWAVPLVAAGVMWRLLVHGNFGALNGLLYQLGVIGSYIPFLSDPVLSLVAVAVAQVWREFPLASILVLAGLQTIPAELHEAARVDGAGALARFRYITLPLLRPSLLVVLVYETMTAIAVFDLVYVLTGGGPGNATTLFSWYTYAASFKLLNLGQGAALSLMMAAGLMLLIAAYLRLLPTEEERA
jgi:multiple sugar transport system permease protein